MTPTKTSEQTELFTKMASPIGELLIFGSETELHGMYMSPWRHGFADTGGWQSADEPFSEVVRQMEQYFARERSEFDLNVRPYGTEFQKRVWNALTEIPYGETCSYGEIATQIGNPGASRAVGMANGRNPVSIIVPCHRVIGANGSMTGYGGGIPNKKWLLDHERGVLF